MKEEQKEEEAGADEGDGSGMEGQRGMVGESLAEEGSANVFTAVETATGRHGDTQTALPLLPRATDNWRTGLVASSHALQPGQPARSRFLARAVWHRGLQDRL
jgi:hypothetical protein